MSTYISIYIHVYIFIYIKESHLKFIVDPGEFISLSLTDKIFLFDGQSTKTPSPIRSKKDSRRKYIYAENFSKCALLHPSILSYKKKPMKW